MTTWTTITPSRGARGRGRPALQHVNVSKPKDGRNTQCRIQLPASIVGGHGRARVRSDGNGKLAFEFCDDGEFRVYKANPAGTRLAVTIPSAFAERVPVGTTTVPTWIEDGRFILDLAALSKAR